MKINNDLLNKATTSQDGIMSKEDKSKLDTYTSKFYTIGRNGATITLSNIKRNVLIAVGRIQANIFGLYFVDGWGGVKIISASNDSGNIAITASGNYNDGMTITITNNHSTVSMSALVL